MIVVAVALVVSLLFGLAAFICAVNLLSDSRYFRVKPYYRWFDMWVGLYWDAKHRHLYIGYFPALGVRLAFPFRRLCHKDCNHPATLACVLPGSPPHNETLCLCSAHGVEGPCEGRGFVHVVMTEQEQFYFED